MSDTGTTCPRRPEVLRLLDGELTRNEEASLRAHLATCAACQREEAQLGALFGDLKADLPRIDAAALADKTMERVLRGDLPSQDRSAQRRTRLLAGATVVLAMAAALAFVLARGARPIDRPYGAAKGFGDEGFQARGGATEPSLQRDVGVSLYAPLAAHHALTDGETIAPDVAFTAAYRNRDRARPVHLLLFAVDARGEVHWLYPAFTDPAQDPAALRLPPADAETPLADSVVLDGVAPGRLRIVTLLARDPLRVSAIESLPAEGRTAAALASRFPAAHVEEHAVTVAAPPAKADSP